MSVLDKLLHGVEIEWKTLGEVAIFRRGSFPQPYGKSEWYDGEGAMPFVQVIDVGHDFRLVVDTKNKISKLAQPKSVFVPKDTVIVTLQGSIGRVAITQYDSYVDRTLAIFEQFQIEIDKKYFAYQLQEKFRVEKETARGDIIKTITKEDFKKFIIPIPPLTVQKEIVRILDTFTELSTKLTTELTAELTARKKQYSYYREQLLSFDDDEVEWKTLGEVIIKSYSGSTPKAGDPKYYDNGTIPWLRTQEVKFIDIESTEIKITDFAVKNTATKWTPSNCVIIAISGATAGRSAINKIPLTTNQHCLCLEINPQVALYRYVFHWVSYNFENIKGLGQGARGDVNSGMIKSFKIPIPPLEEQERIVTILDKFDILTTSISEGLPKEIELRKKQYEYYRDLLLTFPKNNIES